MKDLEARSKLAASNNADLYDAVFHAHGLAGERTAALWQSEAPAPPYYANLTTLAPEAVRAQFAAVERLQSIVAAPFAVKDAFFRLDLADLGFQPLFEASWIWSGPSSTTGQSAGLPADWRRISDAKALSAWEQAWSSAGSPSDERVFLPALLDNPAIVVLGRESRAGFDAGCIVNASADVTGISNVFSTETPAASIFAEATAAAASLHPHLPLVGYESGDELEAAQAAGFEPIGRLRVWLSG